jgi:hypothetical protein
MTSATTFYLEDSNEKQFLNLEIDTCKSLKLLMKSFYDLYGRVIVYDLKVNGIGL